MDSQPKQDNPQWNRIRTTFRSKTHTNQSKVTEFNYEIFCLNTKTNMKKISQTANKKEQKSFKTEKTKGGTLTKINKIRSWMRTPLNQYNSKKRKPHEQNTEKRTNNLSIFLTLGLDWGCRRSPGSWPSPGRWACRSSRGRPARTASCSPPRRKPTNSPTKKSETGAACEPKNTRKPPKKNRTLFLATKNGKSLLEKTKREPRNGDLWRAQMAEEIKVVEGKEDSRFLDGLKAAGFRRAR